MLLKIRPIRRPWEDVRSSGGGLLLLEDDRIYWDTDTNANSPQHGKSHLQRLMLHPVQVVHVLGMEVVWLIMAMPSHPLHTSGMESTRSWLGGFDAGGEEADPGAEAAVERRRHRLRARVLAWSPPPE